LNQDSWAALERAVALAVRSHAGQRDKLGEPYILHLLRVMQDVHGPSAKQAAVLHDYMEDVAGTVEMLQREGLDRDAMDAIIALTHNPVDSYCVYVIRLSSNPIAKQVKLADLRDNYRLDRVAYRATHTIEDSTRIQKYILSYQFLSKSIDESEYRSRMQEINQA
jgi:hypothetical protein